VTLALVLATGAARAVAEDAGPMLHAEVVRGQVLVGEPVAYRGYVTLPVGRDARWAQPDSSDRYEFSDVRARRTHGMDEDTLWIDATVRPWSTGRLRVPGPGFVLDDEQAPSRRLPAVGIEVGSILKKGGKDAELLPWRAPLSAPWWERVPWTWVAVGALAVAAIAFIVFRPRKQVVPVVVAKPPPDPSAEALAALARLRARRLHEASRYAEHAFELGVILRTYLEATVGTARPGDTTPELVAHLEQARLSVDELRRMHALLSEWDQIKFARQATTREQALRSEREVEGYVRRRLAPPKEA
jgi:hypothetical protein